MGTIVTQYLPAGINGTFFSDIQYIPLIYKISVKSKELSPLLLSILKVVTIFAFLCDGGKGAEIAHFTFNCLNILPVRVQK